MQIQSVRVSVRYLGYLHDIAGQKEDNFQIPTPAHVHDVISRAAEAHPRLSKIKDVLVVSVNNHLTRENRELRDGDSLILIAPLVGG